MKNKYIIATVKTWNIELVHQFISNNPDKDISLISNNEELNHEKIDKIKPRYIFFIHWSWKIPAKIYENNECIIFHMTDVPFGRGGSPLQNLIERGIKETKISALKADKELDAGPIYQKKELSLEGSAEEIYKRTAKIIFNHMIPYIIENEPTPIPQQGKIVMFKRRKPEESDIAHLDTIKKVYDYIRMLDAEDYPLAYIETDALRIEFSNATMKNGVVTAKATITKKDLKK